MTEPEQSIPEEVVGLEYFFLPPDRLTQVELALRALQADRHLEFMLAVLSVTINDHRLPPQQPAGRATLRKLLQTLDEANGELMLYESPYNDLGAARREEFPERITWWDYDLADRLCEFPDLHSVRAFLEFGSGTSAGRSAVEAQALHDFLLHGLVGASTNYVVWGCTNIRTPGVPPSSKDCGAEGGIWPAEVVSPWFHGIFWDDLLFVLNPQESTLSILAITSS
jgi:hypothetical protein